MVQRLLHYCSSVIRRAYGITGSAEPPTERINAADQRLPLLSGLPAPDPAWGLRAFLQFGVLPAFLTYTPVLLRELAKSFLHELRLTASVDSISGPGDMTWFVEDHIIKAVGGPVVLVIDEVDKVFEQPYRSDFFGMIRGWHNARARVRSPWKQVDLVLAISTEPHLLMVDRFQSPFNVSPPIRLKWFALADTQTLNERYGMPLEPNDVVRVHEFVGGHPYLTQLVFYELSRKVGPGLVRFLIAATDHDSAFAPHLNTLFSHLQERPELKLIEGFQRIVRFGQSPSDDVAYRLQAAGLVRREENRVVPSNELYARFFGRPDV